MQYEGRICRGPVERGSFMLPVSVGCPYNRCKFCDLFTDLKYREISQKEILKELQRVKSVGGNPRIVYLGDGNAFQLKTEKLREIIEMVRVYFPNIQFFDSDATVTSILRKSKEELRILRELGYRRLYIGIESGLDDVLTYMDKDHSLSQAYDAIDRLKEAGFEYAAHIMTGVAGHGRSQEAGNAMAQFINHTLPRDVVNFSIFLHAPRLMEEIKAGRFSPATELENLIEEREILEGLRIPAASPLRWDGFHDWIRIKTHGELPRDREKMLRILDDGIAKFSELPDFYSMYTGNALNDSYSGILGRQGALEDVFIANEA